MVLETCRSQVMSLFQCEEWRRNCFFTSFLTWLEFSNLQVFISHHRLFLSLRSERMPHATCLRDRQTEEPLSSSPIMQPVWGWELNASCVSLWPKLTHCIPPKVNVWWRRDGEPEIDRAALLSISGSAERWGSLTWPALRSGGGGPHWCLDWRHLRASYLWEADPNGPLFVPLYVHPLTSSTDSRQWSLVY